ncbi:uncharacterized protein EHS24_009107 [Apiotrichum porosum]|uniref:Uncharacterized protein n=1 Tax=Apiotrichum porosum TaxID=105984 RepID=A0A427XP53_9TREE|nr:uncharacterized protein EHS24_009107 [Apiotrichum porosum]RSH80527.1 hypothetical protein EHS24_009107 [Apiotrichum porosum]
MALKRQFHADDGAYGGGKRACWFGVGTGMDINSVHVSVASTPSPFGSFSSASGPTSAWRPADGDEGWSQSLADEEAAAFPGHGHTLDSMVLSVQIDQYAGDEGMDIEMGVASPAPPPSPSLEAAATAYALAQTAAAYSELSSPTEEALPLPSSSGWPQGQLAHEIQQQLEPLAHGQFEHRHGVFASSSTTLAVPPPTSGSPTHPLSPRSSVTSTLAGPRPLAAPRSPRPTTFPPGSHQSFPAYLSPPVASRSLGGALSPTNHSISLLSANALSPPSGNNSGLQLHAARHQRPAATPLQPRSQWPTDAPHADASTMFTEPDADMGMDITSPNVSMAALASGAEADESTETPWRYW